MGIRFRKSIKIAPGVKMNLGAKSAGVSIGPKGAKLSVNSKGRRTTTVGIPGTGISYSTSKSIKKSKRGVSQQEVYRDTDYTPKSKTTALLLCIFLGFFGIHRFYTNHTLVGVLYLFSMGGFLIGWIIDICKIANGSYLDKNGNLLM